MRGSLIALAAALSALALCLLGLWFAGFDPWAVATTAWRGAFGTWIRTANTATEAIPLILCGLGAVVALRSGALNVGLEGQCWLGAVAAVAVAVVLPVGWWTIPLALTAGAIAGAAWVAIAVALERGRGVPLVLSTILLNTIAGLLLGVLIQGPLHDPSTTAPQSPVIDPAARLSPLFDGLNLHSGALLAVIAALATWIALIRTSVGFELTVAGLNPIAARHAGIPVATRLWQAALLSGALAGTAGAVQVLGVTYFLSSDARSWGYAGIAVALLARLHPLGVIVSAVFFAGLDGAGRQLERRLDIPHDLGDVAKGLAVLIALLAAAIAVRRR
jgi:ABC-type uncharacterized transport system permease subunit